MEHRDWHGLLEEITQTEIDINTNGDPDGVKVAKLHALKAEVREHPAGAAGRDLPPITGTIGNLG